MLWRCGFSVLEEEGYHLSSVRQGEGSITQISRGVKVQHEHLSKFKNKCQCLRIDYVKIFNSPDLFTEKFLDIYGRVKNFPRDLIKVKVQTGVLFEI